MRSARKATPAPPRRGAGHTSGPVRARASVRTEVWFTRTMRSAAVLALLLGCGGPQRPAASMPACDAVAVHLLELAEQDNAAAASPALGAGIRAEFERQCRTSPWTAARRSCLFDATSQDAALTCPTN